VKRIDKSVRRRRSGAGTTIVEATIVFPLLLMLVFGIAEFGISFTRWNSLTNAVREGARVGVVFRSPCDSATVTSLVQTTVADFSESSGIDSSSITTTVTGACLGTGTQLEVTASVPYTYQAVAALANFSPSATLSARSVMRNE